MIAELVSRLIAAGTPPEVAASVVAEAFAEGVRSVEIRGLSVDVTAERRRAKDRDRKRLERESLRKSADIPQTSNPPLTLTSSPQDKSIEEVKKVRARKRAASELSADWHPLESHFAAAERLKISRPAVLDKAEDMRLWAKANGAMKVDWDSTFHGFLRRDASKLSTGARHGQTARDRSRDDFRSALGKLREFGEGEVRGDDGGKAVQLLPPARGG